MSFVPSALPKAVRVLRPVSAASICQPTTQRCLHTFHRPSLHNDRSQQVHQRRAFHPSPTSLSTKNPYDVLGVDKSASTSDIKKAYYAAAKKYHPDSSKEPNAREKFQEVQAAYEILSDSEKKTQFDQYGPAGFDAGAGGGFHPGASGFGGGFSGFGGGFGAEFSFEDLFSAVRGGGRAGGRRRNPFAEEIVVGENINVQTIISFMDAAKGRTMDIKVEPLVGCRTCGGSGIKSGVSKKECGRCGGTGTRVHFMQGGFQMAATCESCGGTGTVIPPGSECNTCHGNGVVRETRTVGVDIPPGVEDGMRMRIGGEGDAPPSSSAEPGQKTCRGDLFVHIRVAVHPQFGRRGSDILYTATIPMTTALLGGTVKIPTLDGEVELRVPTGTNTGDKITMSGMGMKKLGGGRRASAGDLRVEFKVNMPKSLTQSQRTLLELLADEFKDKTAKRIMNVSQFSQQQQSDDKQQSPPSSGEDGHDSSHSGFLKRAWDKLKHLDALDGEGGKKSSGPGS